MKKLLFLTLTIVVAYATAIAVPAKPGINTVTLPDGSTLQVALAGDEWHHSFITLDGFTIRMADDGFFYYVTVDGISETRAHDADDRSMDEKAFIEANREQMTMQALYKAKMISGKLRSRTNGISIKAAEVPTSGSPRIPIILVQYSNISMKHTKAQFETHYNTQTWSVLQYFTDQSKGAFTPQFDIYGVYTLPNNRSYYGGNNSSGDDQRVGQMVQDAISQAGNNINWAQYDNDGDGYADACIVVYAGPGEAAGAAAETIWPCQWYLSSAIGNYITRNNTKIDKFAVFCELDGDSDSGTTLDGVGTFCHEFSHCLGLPDFYMTTSGSYFGMGDWSILDRGCYNNSGNRPCGYTAYERNFMGWMTLSTPTEGETYTISTVQDGGQAFKITSDNANEYYVIENIQKTGWNQYARSSGLQVTHVNYNATRWNNNTVNNYSDQGMTIIPADNSLKMNYYSGYGYYLDEADEAGDLYPYGGNNKLTSNSTPAATLYNSSTNLNKPITNITKNSDGTVSFTYMDANAATGGTASDKYLDIANYETIDDAGWNTTYVNKMYKYTEYQSQQVAWLTLSVYGAWTGYRYTNNAGPQKWISSNISTNLSNAYSNMTWSNTPTYTNPFNGSSAYFTGSGTTNGAARALGYYNGKTTNTARDVSFFVTNTTAVKLYGINNGSVNANYPSRLRIFECELSADGTPTPAANPVKNLSNSTASTTFTLEATDLDDSKIYKVEASVYRGALYEIAFQTPLNKPTLKANPTDISMRIGPGETKTATFNVKGKNLSAPISVSLSDQNGVFAVSPDNISIANAEATSGTDVTVTFSPSTEGNYNGTITLTSGDLSATVNLTGVCAETGTASTSYLNIAKYATIDQAGWNSSDIQNLYKYTEHADEDAGWLTVANYGVYLADATQNWFDGNITWNIESGWNGTDVFLGSTSYFGDATAYLSLFDTDNYTITYQNFYVTNCTQVKQYAYNWNNSQYPLKMRIYECTENANGTLAVSSSTVDVKQNSGTGFEVITSTDLDPNKIYKVEIANDYSALAEIAFKTPLTVPTLVADPAEIDFIVEPGTTVNESFTVTGRRITDDVSVVLTDPNGVYNVPVTSITKNDALNGYTVNVTFTAPESMGSYRGQLALTSGTASATVGLYGSVGEKGSAYSRYLDIAKYSSIGTSSMYSGIFDKPYEFTEDETNECAWLSMPTAMSYVGWIFNDQNWARPGNAGVYSGTNWHWNANSPLLGDAYYYGSYTTYFMGEGIHYYNVTNCTQVKTLVYSDDMTDYTDYYPTMQIFELTENADGTLTEGERVDVQTGSESEAEMLLTSAALDPTKIYRVYMVGYVSYFEEVAFKTPLVTKDMTLANIERELYTGNRYKISDELVAVYADVHNGNAVLWCKDQGNASINPSTMNDGQIDFMRDPDICGTTGQLGEWDQSNWVMLKFPEATTGNGIANLLNGAVGKKVAAGTVTGKYTDNRNYTIEVLPIDGNYTLSLKGTGDYTKNVYCAANFLESNLNINGNTGAVGTHGDQYFFMNPKIQEVCEITYAMWDGEKFTTPNNTELQGAFNVDWTRNSIGTPTLQDGQTYRFVAIVSHPQSLNVLRGGGTPSSDIIVYPANLNGDSNIVTAINSIYGDTSHGEVVGVEYVNSLGVVGSKPFSGVNIVVTHYSDGTTTTVKKIFK